MTATVSVIIPCRNMEAHIGAAIESALTQTQPVSEIIVIDDRSSDASRAIAEGFGGIVRVIDGFGAGSAIARNLGIVNARGDVIAFLDADDAWAPGKNALQLQRLEADSDVGFVCANWTQSDTPAGSTSTSFDSYSRVSDGEVFGALLHENFVLTSTVMVRKRLLAKTGLFHPALIGGQDHELWLRLARVTRFVTLREPLAVKGVHGGNITASGKYASYQARKWQQILWEHRDVSASDQKLMRSRYRVSLHDAGRAAFLRGALPEARAFFKRELGESPLSPGALVWLAACSLPRPALERLTALKRSLSGSGST